MKITLNAREVHGNYEFEVVADEPMTYKDYKKMYVALTNWMNENAEQFKGPSPAPDNKTVTHKIQYQDIKKVMRGISLAR